jgi:hypothetical protein
MWHYIKKNFKKTIKNNNFFLKKEKNRRRVGEPPPGPVQGGQTMGGGLATPWQKKKLKKLMGFSNWGWPNHPLGPQGWFAHP